MKVSNKTRNYFLGAFVLCGLIGALGAFDNKPKVKEPAQYVLKFTPQQLKTRLGVLQFAAKYAGKVGPSDVIDAVRDSLNSYIQQDADAANAQLIPDTTSVKKK
jgi:hypothetical protein